MSNSTYTGGMFVAIVKPLKSASSKANRHGITPVLLVPVAGKCPVKRAIDGTVAADSMKLEEEKTYLFNVTLGEVDPTYGQEYNFQAIKEVSEAMEILQMSVALGPATLVD